MKNTITSKVLSFVANAKAPVTSSEVAAAASISPSQAASLLLQSMQRGRVSRREVRTSASNTPVYGYFIPSAKEPVVYAKEPVVYAKEPVVYDEVAVAAPKTRKHKPAGLDLLVDQMASALVTQLVSRVKSRLFSELENLLPAVEEPRVDVSPLIERLSTPLVKHDEPKRKPRVGVVGLMPTQAGEITAEFHDCMDVRFWNDGENRESLKALAKNSDVVFLHTRHASHVTDQYLVTCGANLRRITGGVSNLKEEMTKYFAEV